MQNFKELITIDTDAMLKDLEAHPELWNQHRYRTSNDVHKQADDILLRCNDPDGTADWMENVNYPALFLLPACAYAMYTLAYMLRTDRIGRVIITRLAANGEIKSHTDNRIIPGFCDYYNRYHIALNDAPACVFYCGDEFYTPKKGQIFQFNNALEHSVINAGESDRLTMIVDLKRPVMRAFYGENEKEQPALKKEETKFLMDQQLSAINPDITYQREHVLQVLPELKPLLEDHYKELALDQDKIPLDPDWAEYDRLEKLLRYHFYTVRDQGQLIGYYGCIIGGHLHYLSTPHAITDLFWINPAYRKLGIGREFFENIEFLLRQFSIKKVVCGAKAVANHQKFFESLGWTLSDYQFIKLLD